MAGVRVPVLPPEWGAVLDQVQQSLTQALAQTEQRLQALEALPTTSISAPALPEHQARCASARQQLDARVDGAAQQVEDTDAALAIVEEALRTWLHSSAAAQRTLAERAMRAIG